MRDGHHPDGQNETLESVNVHLCVGVLGLAAGFDVVVQQRRVLVLEERASAREQHREEGLVDLVDARLSRNGQQLARQRHGRELLLLDGVRRHSRG